MVYSRGHHVLTSILIYSDPARKQDMKPLVPFKRTNRIQQRMFTEPISEKLVSADCNLTSAIMHWVLLDSCKYCVTYSNLVFDFPLFIVGNFIRLWIQYYASMGSVRSHLIRSPFAQWTVAIKDLIGSLIVISMVIINTHGFTWKLLAKNTAWRKIHWITDNYCFFSWKFTLSVFCFFQFNLLVTKCGYRRKTI